MQQRILQVMTVLFIVVTGVLVVQSKMKEGESFGQFVDRKLSPKPRMVYRPPSSDQQAAQEAFESAINDTDGSNGETTAQADANDFNPQGTVSPVGGQSSTGPKNIKTPESSIDSAKLADLPQVARLPWDTRQITDMFQQKTAVSVELLPKDSPVSPALVRPSGKGPVLVGRLPAFTIGLEFDSLAAEKLPEMTSDRIQTYMAEHRLAITVPVFWSAAKGYFLSPDIKAAFFNVGDPMKAVTPESIVSAALRDLRVVGTVGNGDVDSIGRTAILGFRYELADELAPGGTREEYEMVLVHLLNSDANDFPRLAVFASQNGREQINDLNLDRPVLNPSIVATVRLDDFSLDGLSPSKSAVTGIRPAVRRTMDAKNFKSIVETSTSEVGVYEALDTIHLRPKSVGLE